MCTAARHFPKIITYYFALIYTVLAQDFGYDGTEGPIFWGEKYHQCVGKHQSPIDIEEHNVEIVSLYPMIFENFMVPPKLAELQNNGHTVQMTINTDKKPQVSGGPLIGKYEFFQLHFHWGSNDKEGSENKINNSSFPMELHMVFFRSAYGSMEEAIAHPDGLTVLSFLFSKGRRQNKKYVPLLQALNQVQNVSSSTIISNMPPFDDLIVSNRSIYFTYGGSLTTPPCSEVVTWIEFKSTIEMAHEQVEVFRQLKNQHGKMSHNFRPVQPLHGRVIRMNQGMTIPLEEFLRKWKNNAPTVAGGFCGACLVAVCVAILQSFHFS